MRILVTGHRGRLGRDLMIALESEHEVIGCDVEEVDIVQKDMVTEFITTMTPEVVLHAAAYTNVDVCEAEIDKAMAVNGDGTRNVAETCRHIDARMIYFSTDYVFDGSKEGDYVEDDKPNPQTVYGRSKLAGEEAVVNVMEDYAIVRIAWLYGMHGHNFVKTMIREGYKQIDGTRGQLRVVDDRRGNPTWTGQVAAQVRPLLDSAHKGIFHATATGSASWYEIAQRVFQTLDMCVDMAPCSADEYPRPAPRPRNSCLVNSRLQKAGIDQMREWGVALEDFLTSNSKRLLDEI